MVAPADNRHPAFARVAKSDGSACGSCWTGKRSGVEEVRGHEVRIDSVAARRPAPAPPTISPQASPASRRACSHGRWPRPHRHRGPLCRVRASRLLQWYRSAHRDEGGPWEYPVTFVRRSRIAGRFRPGHRLPRRHPSWHPQRRQLRCGRLSSPRAYAAMPTPSLSPTRALCRGWSSSADATS